MIVVDTNIISYLLLPTVFSDKASKLYQSDPDWVAPVLWRSEFLNVLALYLRKKIITLAEALVVQEEAETLMMDSEFSVPSVSILSLADSSTCSAYDCEFIALAKQLSVKLVTEDKKILSEFPDVAISLAGYV
jgi:predicted nucleic acid-binding protein